MNPSTNKKRGSKIPTFKSNGGGGSNPEGSRKKSRIPHRVSSPASPEPLSPESPPAQAPAPAPTPQTEVTDIKKSRSSEDRGGPRKSKLRSPASFSRPNTLVVTSTPKQQSKTPEVRKNGKSINNQSKIPKLRSSPATEQVHRTKHQSDKLDELDTGGTDRSVAGARTVSEEYVFNADVSSLSGSGGHCRLAEELDKVSGEFLDGNGNGSEIESFSVDATESLTVMRTKDLSAIRSFSDSDYEMSLPSPEERHAELEGSGSLMTAKNCQETEEFLDRNKKDFRDMETKDLSDVKTKDFRAMESEDFSDMETKDLSDVKTKDFQAMKTKAFSDSDQEMPSPEEHPIEDEGTSSFFNAKKCREPTRRSPQNLEDEPAEEQRDRPEEADSRGTTGESGFHEDSNLTAQSSPMSAIDPGSDADNDDDERMDGSGSDGSEDLEDHRRLRGVNGSHRVFHVSQPQIVNGTSGESGEGSAQDKFSASSNGGVVKNLPMDVGGREEFSAIDISNEGKGFATGSVRIGYAETNEDQILLESTKEEEEKIQKTFFSETYEDGGFPLMESAEKLEDRSLPKRETAEIRDVMKLRKMESAKTCEDKSQPMTETLKTFEDGKPPMTETSNSKYEEWNVLKTGSAEKYAVESQLKTESVEMYKDQTVPKTGSAKTREDQIVLKTGSAKTWEDSGKLKTKPFMTYEDCELPLTVATGIYEDQNLPKTQLSKSNGNREFPKSGCTETREEWILSKTESVKTLKNHEIPMAESTETYEDLNFPKVEYVKTGSSKIYDDNEFPMSGSAKYKEQSPPKTQLAKSYEDQSPPKTKTLKSYKDGKLPMAETFNRKYEEQNVLKTGSAEKYEVKSHPKTESVKMYEDRELPKAGSTRIYEDQNLPKTQLSESYEGSSPPKTQLAKSYEDQSPLKTPSAKGHEDQSSPKTVLAKSYEDWNPPRTDSTKTYQDQSTLKTPLAKNYEDQSPPKIISSELYEYRVVCRSNPEMSGGKSSSVSPDSGMSEYSPGPDAKDPSEDLEYLTRSSSGGDDSLDSGSCDGTSSSGGRDPVITYSKSSDPSSSVPGTAGLEMASSIAGPDVQVRHQTTTTVSSTRSWQTTTRSASPAPAPTLSTNTEKILATSNMLKACIGQAALGSKFRGLRATTPLLTRFEGLTGPSRMGHRRDDDHEEGEDRPDEAIEDVQDMAALQKMLDAATNYDQRRRIRAQMRNVKKASNDDKPASSLFVFDVKNGAAATPGHNEVNYASNDVGQSAQQVWQAIDSMVATSLTVDSDLAPVKNGNSHRSSYLPEDPNLSLKMGDNLWVNGVNLADCTDELKLHELLDNAEDYEDRKIIRARLKDVLAFNRAQREAIISRREEEREEAIRARLRDANEQKRRTLAMYDAMAKSAPAGGNKVLDIGILRGEGSGSSTPTSQTEKVDYVEESIRQRVKESDDRKKVILAAYDQAAKSGPAGSARFVDFDNVKPEDIYDFEHTPKHTSTFQMKGGVPIARPATPVISRPAVHPQPYDPEEAAIRRRAQESDERKRRTLEAYDKAARSRPAGTPFSVYIPTNMDIEPVVEVVGRPHRISGPNTPMTPPTQVRSAAHQQPPPPQPPQPPTQQPWARGPQPHTQSQYRGPPLSNPPGHFYQPQQQPQQQQHYQNQQQITLQTQNYQNRQPPPQQHQQNPQQIYQPYGPTHDYAPQPIQLQNQYRNVPNFRPVAPHPTAVGNNVSAAQKVTTTTQQRQVTTTVSSNQQARQVQPPQKPQVQQQQQRSTATVNLTSSNQTRAGNTTTTTTTTTRKQYYEEEDDDEEEEEEESDEE